MTTTSGTSSEAVLTYNDNRNHSTTAATHPALQLLVYMQVLEPVIDGMITLNDYLVNVMAHQFVECLDELTFVGIVVLVVNGYQQFVEAFANLCTT